jgi:hypothetical protein
VKQIPPEGAASPTDGPDGPQSDGAEAEQPPAAEVESDVDPLPQRIRRRTRSSSSKPDARPTDDGVLDRLLTRLREI